MSSSTYDSHLDRIGNRPGESLQNWLVRKMIDRALESTKPLPLSTIRALEVGPGVGRCAAELLSRDIFYTAIEPTGRMRKNLLASFENNSKFEGVFPNLLPDVTGLPLAGYDLIVAMHVLEHTTDQYNAREFLSACKELLKPGGTIFIVCPDYADYKSVFFDIDWSHGYPTTTERIRGLLEDIGMQDVTSHGTRLASNSILIKFACYILNTIIPYKILDQLFLRVLGDRLLATGFSVGFLKRNVIAVGTKKL